MQWLSGIVKSNGYLLRGLLSISSDDNTSLFDFGDFSFSNFSPYDLGGVNLLSPLPDVTM